MEGSPTIFNKNKIKVIKLLKNAVNIHNDLMICSFVNCKKWKIFTGLTLFSRSPVKIYKLCVCFENVAEGRVYFGLIDFYFFFVWFCTFFERLEF
jgi:hypothetical protein